MNSRTNNDNVTGGAGGRNNGANEWRYRWSPESIEWYRDADRYTGYNRKIAEALRGHLRPADSVFELACGTGRLALCASPLVREYTACDAEGIALSALERDAKELGLENLTVIRGSWEEELDKRAAAVKPDVVMYQQFRGITSDWERLASSAGRAVIGILPRDEEDHAEGRSGHGGRETLEKAAAYLDSLGVEYETAPLTLEFGQPFRSLDEVLLYDEYYSRMLGRDVHMAEKKRIETEDPEFPYFVPKTRKIGIIAARV